MKKLSQAWMKHSGGTKAGSPFTHILKLKKWKRHQFTIVSLFQDKLQVKLDYINKTATINA